MKEQKSFQSKNKNRSTKEQNRLHMITFLYKRKTKVRTIYLVVNIYVST